MAFKTMAAFKKQFWALRRSNGGNMAVITALAAVPLLGAAGIAIDYARISRVHDRIQFVADGAALAAASARNLTGTGEQIAKKRAAIASAFIAKGLSSIADATTVGAPAITATTSLVSVRMTASVQGSLTAVLNSLSSSAEMSSSSGGNSFGVRSTFNVTANSEASWTTGTSLLCILALNKTAAQALEIQGTADVVAPSCAVWVNSNSNSALYLNGNATLTAKSVCVTGAYTGTAYTPKPMTGAEACPVYADPLAYLFQPGKDYETEYAAAKLVGSQTCAVGASTFKCQFNGYSTTNKKYAPLTLTGSSTNQILEPGVYDGGLQIKAGATARLKAGTYFIQNGKFEVQQGNVVNADSGGVTIVLTEPMAGSKVTNGTQTRLDIQAHGTVNLKAPAAGKPFAGVVLTQHPNSLPTATKTTANTIIGGGTKKLLGIIYYPTQFLYITGSGGGTISNPEAVSTDSPQFAIVADRILVEGNGQLRVGGSANNDAAGLPALPSMGKGQIIVSLR
jgi:Flp pilus assembly protein TadG